MAAPVIPIKLLREIRNLRKDLDYMYRRYYRLSHPAVLKTSRKLDKKISEYQQIWSASE